MSLPVDLRKVLNAVFNSKLIPLHIPSIFPVKTLRLISVWIIVFLARISSISLSIFKYIAFLDSSLMYHDISFD